MEKLRIARMRKNVLADSIWNGNDINNRRERYDRMTAGVIFH